MPWTPGLPRFARRFGAGQPKGRVKARVDRDLRIITEAIWFEMEALGIVAPSSKKRGRR